MALPLAAGREERTTIAGDGAERRRHAESQRQTASYEWLSRPRERERQHRNNARTDARRHAAEVGKNQKQRGGDPNPPSAVPASPAVWSADTRVESDV